MKKTIITLAAVLTLGAASLLSSCAGNTMTGGNNSADESSAGSVESAGEAMTEKDTDNILDEAESRLEDMSEDATHGVEDSTPDGHSSRSRQHHHMMPRGK